MFSFSSVYVKIIKKIPDSLIDIVEQLCTESQGDIHMTPTNITPAKTMRNQ